MHNRPFPLTIICHFMYNDLSLNNIVTYAQRRGIYTDIIAYQSEFPGFLILRELPTFNNFLIAQIIF